MQLVTNVVYEDHHHHQQRQQQQQLQQQQQQQEQEQVELEENHKDYYIRHCHHHLHLRRHHHQHHQHLQNSFAYKTATANCKHLRHCLMTVHRPPPPDHLQHHHHNQQGHCHHNHHHHHQNYHYHYHHRHWSVTMTTVALLVSLLACSMPVATSIENKDSKLAAPGQEVIMEPHGIHNSNNNNSIHNNNNNSGSNNNNAMKFIPLQSKLPSSLDNLKFKAVESPQQQQQVQDKHQPNVLMQQQQQQQHQQQPQQQYHQGIPPPVQPSQEYKFKNWENPPPPPPQKSSSTTATSEPQKSFWLPGDQQKGSWQDQGRGVPATESWHHQEWNQEQNHNQQQQQHHQQQQQQNQPLPDAWVDRETRKDVEWNYNANYYSLKASSDARFLIRYSPPATPGSPWPLPQTYKSSHVALSIDPRLLEFHVTVGAEKYTMPRQQNDPPGRMGDDFDDERDYNGCSIVDFNVDRATKNAFGGYWDKARSRVLEDKWVSKRAVAKDNNNNNNDDVEGGGSQADGSQSTSSTAALKKFIIKVYKGCEEQPHLHMNESYSLMVSSSQVVLISPEVWGVVRGLETFSQLVYQEEKEPFKFLINMTTIVDFPRFKHRGILLDTSRHYLEVSTILENLESMSQNKFNVFHWHIVDDQSFPFKSYSYPNLTVQGAYDYDTHIYTHEDIELIIEFARLRGIRVIPEFDTPGHTFSWGFGQSHLLTPCHDLSGLFNGLYGPINPILRKNYNFLKNLFKEVMSVFKDKYLHLGGDEVPFDCWLSNPQIRKFMNKNVITDIKQILSFYARQLFSLISNNAKELKRDTGSIVWQEMFDNDVELPKDTIIQVWSGDSFDLERITKMGYATLFSTCWYLDYIQYGQDWDKYYLCEHISNLRLKNESLFYGGEVCLWAEYTDDSDILTRLWPRASAAAERLWSSKATNNLYRAAPRLEMQRCRMMERGLQVGVLSGPSHCTKFRKKRAQFVARHEGSNPSPNLSNPDKNDESYPLAFNQDKRKLNRYGNAMEFNSRQKPRRTNSEDRLPNVGLEKESDSVFSFDFLSASGSVSLYVLICFAFFLIFFFLKKKWVKLPIPTYFLTRNYRAFIICLILLTAVFILLQHVRFFKKFPNTLVQFKKSSRSG